MPPERLAGWVSRFGERHGGYEVAARAEQVELVAPDGARAELEVPFPPLPPGDDPVPSLVEHALVTRRVGALLVRKGGYAVGIFRGTELDVSKVGHSYVQGRTKAGGWSQQRFARRRANQAELAYAGAADVVAQLLLPRVDVLAAVFGGGDKGAVRAVLADPRLTRLKQLLVEPVLPTVDPRLRVLQAFPEQFRAVSVRLNALA